MARCNECVGVYKLQPFTTGIVGQGRKETWWHYYDMGAPFVLTCHDGQKVSPFTHIRADIPIELKATFRAQAMARMLYTAARMYEDGVPMPITTLHNGIHFDVRPNEFGNICIEVTDIGISESPMYGGALNPDSIGVETEWDTRDNMKGADTWQR